MTFCRSLAIGAVVSVVAGQQRPPPIMPNAWMVNFSETTSIIIASYNTTGSWYYDFSDASSPRQRLDRATGKNDRYCGTVVTEDAPCSHLVVAGERYLIWPTLSKCCGCCNSTSGCGVVRPTWMRDANGTWAGTAPFSGPVWSGSADSWQINGAQPNFWFVEAGTQIPVGFAQVPDDYQYFDPASYVVGPQADSLFTLPTYCEPSCNAGICAIIN